MENGYIVGFTDVRPEKLTCLAWGGLFFSHSFQKNFDAELLGRIKDIKRRPTENYMFATCGDYVYMWSLTPRTGQLQYEKCLSFAHSHHRQYTYREKFSFSIS